MAWRSMVTSQGSSSSFKTRVAFEIAGIAFGMAISAGTGLAAAGAAGIAFGMPCSVGTSLIAGVACDAGIAFGIVCSTAAGLAAELTGMASGETADSFFVGGIGTGTGIGAGRAKTGFTSAVF